MAGEKSKFVNTQISRLSKKGSSHSILSASSAKNFRDKTVVAPSYKRNNADNNNYTEKLQNVLSEPQPVAIMKRMMKRLMKGLVLS